MPRDEAQFFRFKDELPEDLRDHTFYRHYPKTEEEYFARVEQLLRKAGIIDPTGKRIARDQRNSVEASPALASLDLTAFARKFAESLIASVAPAQLLSWAAPARLKTKSERPRDAVFSPRLPEFVPQRHEKYLAAIDNRGFARTAITEGRSEQHGGRIRNEMLLIALVKGQPIAMSIVEPKFAHPPEGEPELAAGIFPTLWTVHERNLVEAEERGLIWDQPTPLMPPRAQLIFNFWRKATELKLSIGTQGSGCYRALFVDGLGPIINAVRQELKKR